MAENTPAKSTRSPHAPAHPNPAEGTQPPARRRRGQGRFTVPVIFASMVFVTVTGTAVLVSLQFGGRLGDSLLNALQYAACAAGVTFMIALLISRAAAVQRAGFQRFASGSARSGSVRLYDAAPSTPGKTINELELDHYTLDSLEGGIFTLNGDGVITSFNAGAERLTGRPAGKAIGRRYARVFKKAPREKDSSDTMWFGDLIEASLTQQQTCSSEDATMVNRDGRAIPIGVTISTLCDSTGAVLGMVVIFKSLEEVKRVRARIRRSEELASLGSLAASMAHEIRNPLASLKGLTELIQDDLPPDHANRRCTETIIHTLDRLNRLVEDLLCFGQPAISRLEAVDPAHILSVGVKFAQFATKQEIEIKTSDASLLPMVQVDPKRIQQALQNIIRNAVAAAGEDGTIDTDAHYETDSTGEWVILSIHNTGSYIPPDELDDIFKPFVSTMADGTGLGLSISNQIVESHGGHIIVESGPDIGTTFNIKLPAFSLGNLTEPSEEEHVVQSADCR